MSPARGRCPFWVCPVLQARSSPSCSSGSGARRAWRGVAGEPPRRAAPWAGILAGLLGGLLLAFSATGPSPGEPAVDARAHRCSRRGTGAAGIGAGLAFAEAIARSFRGLALVLCGAVAAVCHRSRGAYTRGARPPARAPMSPSVNGRLAGDSDPSAETQQSPPKRPARIPARAPPAEAAPQRLPARRAARLSLRSTRERIAPAEPGTPRRGTGPRRRHPSARPSEGPGARWWPCRRSRRRRVSSVPRRVQSLGPPRGAPRRDRPPPGLRPPEGGRGGSRTGRPSTARTRPDRSRIAGLVTGRTGSSSSTTSGWMKR